MYFNIPGSRNANHKKGYCADGARSVEPKPLKNKNQGNFDDTVNHNNHNSCAPGGNNTDTGDDLNAGSGSGNSTQAEEDSIRFNDLSPPQWPQPQGIFGMGIAFDPETFLRTVRDLFEKIADHEARNLDSTIPYEYTLEDIAFSHMLRSRTEIIDGHTFFRLYDLTLTSGSAYEPLISDLVVKGHPGRYLRIDCL